jgi:hypothetical protein
MMFTANLFVRLREEGGIFVRDYARWTVWGTVTYWRDKVSDGEVREDMKYFLRSLAKKYGTHIPFALGMEEQLRGVLHAHLLLVLPGIEKDEGAELLRAWWGQGRSEFKMYVPKENAAYYLAGHWEWYVQTACPRFLPCRRAMGCKEAIGPW